MDSEEIIERTKEALIIEVNRMNELKERECNEQMDEAGFDRIQAAIDKMNDAYVILDSVF